MILCYDIIPILFPEWYADHDVRNFRDYYRRAFASADRVIFNAQTNERDARYFDDPLAFSRLLAVAARRGRDAGFRR